MFDHLKTVEEKYEAFVHFVATDYYELSHDKIKWQRDDWMKRARKLLEEAYRDDLKPDLGPLDDDF